MRRLLATVALTVGLTAPAAAATPTAHEFSQGITAASSPDDIAAGPDGNLWFVESNGDRIARITSLGQVTEFTLTGVANPGGITAGPDGNMWFTESSASTTTKAIGRITPSGAITETIFTHSPVSTLNGVTAGPDGTLWFTDGFGGVGRADTLGNPPILSYADFHGFPDEIVTGADGKLWFTETDSGTGHKIARMDPTGFSPTSEPDEFTITDEPRDIAAGPDGKIWFTQGNGTTGAIGRLDPNASNPGSTITYLTPGLTSDPRGIVAGPDGNMWVAEGGDLIGRITPSGSITEFSAGITSIASPSRIAAGPDGNLWFTEFFAQRVARINTALEPMRFTDPGRIEIPGNIPPVAEPYPAKIEVSGLQGTVTDVNVRFNGLHHAFADDVEALLVGPQGQKALLIADSTGGMARDVAAGPVLTFDDEGVTSPTWLVSGVFKPIVPSTSPTFDAPAPAGPYGSALSLFDGTNPTGTWELWVRDDTPGFTGVLTGWSLDIRTTGPPPQEIPGPPIQVPVPGPTTTVTMPGPTVTAPADTTRPGLRLSGPPARTTQTAFRAGPKLTVTPSEPVTLDVTMSVKPKTVSVANTDALLLFDRTIKATRATPITVKPATRFLGRPKKAFRATLRIVASDAAGNCTTVTRTITVAPDKKKTRSTRR
jgi:streptogramin lyase